MARQAGTKNHLNPGKEASKVRAATLCSALLNSIAQRAPQLSKTKVIDELLGGSGPSGRRKFYRWLQGESPIDEAAFRLLVRTAKARRWIDDLDVAMINEAARKPLEHLESKKAHAHELKAFIKAKKALLANLASYAEVCANFKHSEVFDAGDEVLQELILASDFGELTEEQQEQVQALQSDPLFAPLPSPDLLIAQLRRQELRGLPEMREHEKKRRKLLLDEAHARVVADLDGVELASFEAAADGPEFQLTGTPSPFAALAAQSKAKNKAQLKRLQQFARNVRLLDSA